MKNVLKLFPLILLFSIPVYSMDLMEIEQKPALSLMDLVSAAEEEQMDFAPAPHVEKQKENIETLRFPTMNSVENPADQLSCKTNNVNYQLFVTLQKATRKFFQYVHGQYDIQKISENVKDFINKYNYLVDEGRKPFAIELKRVIAKSLIESKIEKCITLADFLIRLHNLHEDKTSSKQELLTQCTSLMQVFQDNIVPLSELALNWKNTMQNTLTRLHNHYTY